MEPVEPVAASTPKSESVPPVANVVAQAPVPPVAHPVAQASVPPVLKLVPPVAQKVKKASGATGGTRQTTPKSANDLEPPGLPGCEWRISGSGWELWRRVPSVSENGKRSSKRTYMAYYSRKAVEGFYARETKTDIRRA